MKLPIALKRILMAVLVACSTMVLLGNEGGCTQEQTISAVTYTVDAMEVASILPTVRQNIDKAVSTLRGHDFGEQQETADELFANVDKLMEKVSAVAEMNTTEAVLLAANVRVFIQEARQTFYGILDLVEPNIDQFSNSIQFQFRTLHQQLTKINRIYEKVEGKGGNITDMVLLALRAAGAGMVLVETYSKEAAAAPAAPAEAK